MGANPRGFNTDRRHAPEVEMLIVEQPQGQGERRNRKLLEIEQQRQTPGLVDTYQAILLYKSKGVERKRLEDPAGKVVSIQRNTAVNILITEGLVSEFHGRLFAILF